MILRRKTLTCFQVYNLGTGKGSSVFDVVKAFEEACGKKVSGLELNSSFQKILCFLYNRSFKLNFV